MTTAVLTVAATEDDEPKGISRDDLQLGIDELEKAAPRYAKAKAYYDGIIDEFILNSKLARVLRPAARAFRINFACIPVDAVAERMRIASITAEGAANEALQEHWTNQRMGIRSRKVELEAAKMGDAYLIAWPDPDDEGKINTWLNGPENCRLIYDEDRPLAKLFGIKRWVTRSGRTRVDLYYPDRIEKVISRDKGSSGKKFVTDANNFTEYYEDDTDETWPAENPFGVIPMFHFRNDEDYGYPEHEKFYGVQNTVFKLIVTHMTGADYQGLPQRWKIATAKPVIGEASVVDTDTFSVEHIEDDEDEQLDSRPGGLWDLKNTEAVGQFDAASDTVFTGPMIIYLRFGAQITNTPVNKIDPTGQVQSGESLRTANATFIGKILDRQEWHEPTWQEYTEFVLTALGKGGARISVSWEPVQSMDDNDAWTVAQAKLDAGVPIQQVFLEMGYEDTQIAQWFGDFDPSIEEDAKALKAVGDALVALGTAAGLLPQSITPDLIDTLIATVLDPRGESNVDA